MILWVGGVHLYTLGRIRNYGDFTVWYVHFTLCVSGTCVAWVGACTSTSLSWVGDSEWTSVMAGVCGNLYWCMPEPVIYSCMFRSYCRRYLQLKSLLYYMMSVYIILCLYLWENGYKWTRRVPKPSANVYKAANSYYSCSVQISLKWRIKNSMPRITCIYMYFFKAVAPLL